MKRLQIVDHNINIGHCKVYSTDFVTNILWFIKLLSSEFRIPNSEFRNPEFRILNSEFRIPHFEKNVVYRKLVSCRTAGPTPQGRLEEQNMIHFEIIDF